MKRPGVNLTVLWEEYGAAHPGGYSYSRFCELYRDFERRLSPTMRQHHVAGDKVFVDYSGKTIAIVERETGEVRPAQLFIAVLGASNYTYAAVSWTKALPDWISAHVQMFAFVQGCPGSSYPTISSRGFTSRHSTIRRSTAATPGWRRITGSASCRPDRTNRVTKRR